MANRASISYPVFTALNCLELIVEQTEQGKKEHKLRVIAGFSEETRRYDCSMFLRERQITVEGIQAESLDEAKVICAEKFLKQLFGRLENIRSELSKALGYLKDKRLFVDKTKGVSLKKEGGFIDRAVEVKSDIFRHQEIVFGATGRATDKMLAFHLAEASIANQLNEHFMLGPLVHTGRRQNQIFEFSCKGYLKHSLDPDLFFERFPEIRDNLIILPDGRAICRICKQMDRSSLFASHHHSSVRRMMCQLHYCIENDDAKLAKFVNRNIAVLLKEQNTLAQFVSENKQFVLDSAIKTLRREISDVKIELFGQSEERMGQCYYVLKFNVSSEVVKSQEQLLATISNTLYYANDCFRFVIEDFSDSYPHIKSSHIETGLDCVFFVRREVSVELSRLFRACSELSSEVRTLSSLFNFWSSYCQLDEADSGYLHQFIFPLMVIHFLQSGVSPPRFPNLHLDQFFSRAAQDPDSPDAFGAQLKSLFERAKEELGTLPPIPIWKLWLLLLQFYWMDFNFFHKIALQLRSKADGTLLPLVREELDKDYSRLFVMNPMRERNNIAFSMKTHHAYLYFFQCFRHTLDFYHSEIGANLPREVLENVNLYSVGTMDTTKGLIVTDGMESVPSKPAEEINLDSGGEETTEGKMSPPLKLEFSVNIGTEDISSATDSTVPVDTSNLTVASSCSEEVAPHTLEHSSEGEETDSEVEDNFKGQPDSPDVEEGVIFSDDVTTPVDNIPESLLTAIRYAVSPGGDDVTPTVDITQEESKKHCNRNNFIRLKFSPICGFCRDKGHTKFECPKESLPPVLPVAPLPRENVRELNEGLLQLVNSHKMSAKESDRREQLRAELETDVREVIGRKFDLCLFGSSVNKFGSDDSDVDLCLVLPPEDAADLDKNRLLRSMAKAFRSKKYALRYTNVSQIPAKVPIIRFDYLLATRTYTCDISLSNLLALNNSRLLLTYASFDQRVQDLGLLVKHFGKVNELADASQGGLSSYAYILLTIHFLQRTDPPIIPVLQQIRPPGCEESSVKVDAWECYFCEDIQTVKQLWKHRQNTQTLADLWMEFLCYCVSKFDWEKQVVTLRQLEPISKLDKMWTNRKIGIEDPFNLDHNLGTVLSFKNAVRLKKCLIESRAFFHEQRSAKSYLGYLHFDDVVLKESKPIRESRKSQPKPAAKKQPPPQPHSQPQPQSQSRPPTRPQDRDRPLLSWSNQLHRHCTQDVHSRFREFDIVQLSETVLIPSDAFSKKRPKPAKDNSAPSKLLNGMDLSSSKKDQVLFAGSHCYEYTLLNPQLNGTVPPTQPPEPPPTLSPPNCTSSPLRVPSSPPPPVLAPVSPESDSITLYEITRRVEQESRDLLPASFPFSPSPTDVPNPFDHAHFPDTLGERLPLPEQAVTNKHMCEKALSPVQPSSDTRPTPSVQKQAVSPGFKTGRGGTAVKTQFVNPGPRATQHHAPHSHPRPIRPQAPYGSTDRNPSSYRQHQAWDDEFPRLSSAPIPIPPPAHSQGGYPMHGGRGAQHSRRGNRGSPRGDAYVSRGRDRRGRGAFVSNNNQRNQWSY